MKYAVGIDLSRIKPYMAGYALDRFLLIEADNKEEAVQKYLEDENIKEGLNLVFKEAKKITNGQFEIVKNLVKGYLESKEEN
jgi:hypothetical protein